MPECPRCGYDLSGEAERWTDACPFKGRCSECGLDVVWGDLLNERLRRPAWLFELAEPQQLRWAFVRTAWRAIRPWRFWRDVRMEYPIAWRRLVVLVVFLFPMLYITLLSAPVAARLGIGNVVNSYPAMMHFEHYWPEIVFPFGALYRWWYPDIRAAAWISALAVLLLPMTLYLLPVTLRSARIRRAHIWRATLYSCAVLPVFVMAVTLAPLFVMLMWFLARTVTMPAWFVSALRRYDAVLERPSGWLVIAWALGASWLWMHAILRGYLRLGTKLSATTLLVLLAWLVATLMVLIMPRGGVSLMYDLNLAAMFVVLPA